ncbi:hypothetical protein DFH08DRAFT_906840 [Mycena albidolilacea]|uniref:Secreted protein n=1 Tax=Mycena albidolilacea TaxID=1033008 RepID=A0AAD6YZ10_9AGAR|nr:hypothetical protein DFH08DRAFT_906840 [Mycena albidolilacea]
MLLAAFLGSCTLPTSSAMSSWRSTRSARIARHWQTLCLSSASTCGRVQRGWGSGSTASVIERISPKELLQYFVVCGFTSSPHWACASGDCGPLLPLRPTQSGPVGLR